MTTVIEHAERVLFGTTLEDKLAPWPDLDVRASHVARTGPVTLGRPKGLELPTGRRDLPSIRRVDLQQEDGRARVLHELMNHELQAIEILALGLLRWPDAPAGFRRGLIATLADEQRHCALYIDRLRETGGEVGQQPVSRFFWDTLSGLERPEQLIAGLSMTFEAANLDFCLSWRERFTRAGDPATAEVLTTVYEDEIRHVALGLAWFNKWTDGDRLDAWERELVSPLTPARARGDRFDREGRRRAGFTEAELDRLRVVGGSRGRPPRVLQFDAGVEDAVAGRSPSKLAHRVSDDLATLPMFLCGAEDVVVAPSPSVAFLARLADAGFAVPRFISELTGEALGPHPARSVEPWGRKPGDMAHDLKVLHPLRPWRPDWAELSSKVATHLRAEHVLQLPGCVENAGTVWSEVGETTGRWVLKAPFSTSGTARIRGEGPMSPEQRRWAEKRLARGPLLLQPWYERVVDVSGHVTVGDEVRIDGWTRFETAANGVYRGAHVGPWTADLPQEVRRALHDRSDGRPLRTPLEAALEAAGRWAQELGYRGPLSIDAAIVRERGTLAVHPWLETNARSTLGRVALGLAARVPRTSRARWWVERRTEERVQELRGATFEVGPHGLLRGIVPTTDPERAAGWLTWLEVTER